MLLPEVILEGKENGEGMIILYRTGKGTSIYGLGLPNIYTESDWNLGPTWCYLIMGHKRTLIDTGRFGNHDVFESLLKKIGMDLSDIDRIIITHSHEDHDGNLAEILASSQAELWAHQIYHAMISYHPDFVEGATFPDLPGSCRFCPMPESIREGCLSYLCERSLVTIDVAVKDGREVEEDQLLFIHTPGHSPDSICITLEDEAFFTGDTLLPEITPHPSLVNTFESNCVIFPEEFREKNKIYGLMNYIKSLHRIAGLSPEPFPITLPGHRLFRNGHFNLIHEASDRAREIIRFHMDRCTEILKTAEGSPSKLEDIAVQHFPPRLLKGSGKNLAINEISAHIEVLEECGDVRWSGPEMDAIQPTGTKHFLDRIGVYLDSSESKKRQRTLRGSEDADEPDKEPKGRKGIIDEL
jgi:glyoxylase-like metal-dependent hydrolase (beta-lactamase superfamily II)